MTETLTVEKGLSVPVLDHGYVKYIDHMGSDESVIEAARMSTNGSFISWDAYEGHPKGDAGLLTFLYKHKHLSPYEMGDLILEVQAPIFVVREWFRHRALSVNEASARYAVMPDLHYVPPVERLVKQDTKNKQAGASDLLDSEVACQILGLLKEEQRLVYDDYSAMLDEGLAREVARINTPVSRYTRFRAKANLRNWLGFLLLRMPENAQQEIRVYAEVVGQIVKVIWPRTWALFEEYDLYGLHLSRTEANEYRAWKKSPEYLAWKTAQKALALPIGAE